MSMKPSAPHPSRVVRPAALALALALTAAVPARANHVTHDLVPLGSAWGGIHGNVPGDPMFSEDSIALTVHDFWSGGAPCCFVEARILPEVTDVSGASVFGSVQTLRVNNVNVRYDFAGIPFGDPDTLKFDFLDLGGTVNLEVNGAGLVEAPDFPSLHGAVLPGGATVLVEPATVTPVDLNLDGTPDGHRGRVRIEAPFPVDLLGIGGQELWVDDVATTRTPPPGPCAVYVGHESQPLAKLFGAVVGQPLGDVMYTEALVELSTALFFPVVGPPIYGDARIAGVFGSPIAFGTDTKTLGMPNMNVRFRFGFGGVTEVEFDWLDLGGDENLAVNGGPLYVGDIAFAPAAIAPGVTFSTTITGVAGGKKGTARLTGPVTEFTIGGQEFWHDNMCIRGALATDTPVLVGPVAAAGLELGSIAPNPFRGGTTVAYSLERAGAVRASVHDLAGRRIRTLVDRVETAGAHSAAWDGRDEAGRAAAAGTYFVRLQSAGEVRAAKLLLLR